MPRKRRIVSASTQVPEQPIERAVKTVKPLNREQAYCIKEIHNNDIIFIDGRVGSGKTYLAAGVGAEYLQRGLIDRLIISRPQIAAENSGFLPGDLEQKISPFLAPLFNELSYFLNVKKEMADGRLIVSPIAYCRGVTWKNSFVIIDECQNMDAAQMKLILTRFGENSKMVLTGDASGSQSDLFVNGKTDFEFILDKMDKVATPENRISIVTLKTCVRHPIIEIVLSALETP